MQALLRQLPENVVPFLGALAFGLVCGVILAPDNMPSFMADLAGPVFGVLGAVYAVLLKERRDLRPTAELAREGYREFYRAVVAIEFITRTTDDEAEMGRYFRSVLPSEMARAERLIDENKPLALRIPGTAPLLMKLDRSFSWLKSYRDLFAAGGALPQVDEIREEAARVLHLVEHLDKTVLQRYCGHGCPPLVASSS